MKLKSISVSGFKTLADRMNLQFHDGITGIIGPNGTGKSNIIASVRWVLGEQFAKNLRDPEEVIFAGSDLRKPLSMAEVVLTFSNDGIGCPVEYIHLPEISIGRRMFRDGKREYFMNKEPCRLKDIVDFLLAIGIGARGFSIIEQERRDRIIQASPDGMREILEETAGITIFKQHRHDAERRLQSTSEKLISLAEIENELKNRSEHLQIQVEKAAEKRAKSEALRERQIAELCYRAGYFRSIARKFREEIERATKDLNEGVMASSGWESQANDLKTEHLELIRQIKIFEEQLDERRLVLVRYNERRDNERKNSEDRARRRELLTSNFNAERDALEREEARHKSCAIEMEKVEEELRQIDSAIETLQDRFDEADENLRVERGRGEEIQSEIRAVQELMTTLRSRNEIVLERIQRANEALRKNNEFLEETRRMRGQIVADKNAQSEQLEALSGGMKEITAQKSFLESELKAVREKLQEAEQKRDVAKEEFTQVSSSLAALQKLQAANEGLSLGAKELQNRFSTFIQGFFFDQVSVDPEDEEVLEHALPDLLQSAFVEDAEKLVDVLDKVEELDLTRVGFLVRDIISPLSNVEIEARDKISKMSGVRSVGLRMKRCVRAEVEHVLGRVFIARDEWLAQKAMREAGAASVGFIFLSERGVVLSNGREICYGRPSGGDATGLLQRKREIAELEERKQASQRQLASSQGFLFEATEKRRDMEARLAEIDSRISKEQIEVLKLSTAIETMNMKISGMDDNLSRLDTDNEEHSREISTEQERFASHQRQLDGCESELREFRSQHEEWAGEQDEKKELRDTLNSQLQDKRTSRLIVDERGRNSRKNYEEISYQLQRLQNSVDRAIAELSAISTQIESSQEDKSSLGREIDRLKLEIGEAEGKLNTLQEREAEVSEQSRVVEGKIRSRRDSDQAQQKVITDKQIELARCSAVVEQTENEAQERFLLSASDLPNEVPAGAISEDKLKKEIAKIANEIEELGAVNERALEEFEEATGRLSMLDTQRGDITLSMNELTEAIGRIEEATKNRFKEIFDKVNTEFQSLFPTLFPGGDARLILVNPENLLTSGVEIFARLPGKKMQRMHLYSGGEKALTAISLIFALLKTHPAPFCFLDEVDAPLDEANVGRFNAVLQMLSSQFQFVVITHNRRTMEVLDRVYGISMQEPGVSKILSVDLTEVPEQLRKKSGASVAPVN